MGRLQDIELPTGDAPDTIHLNPASEFHPLVLLPEDPARAMAIATDQLTRPRMFNHRRGLWGYSGETPEGLGLIIQSTGIGGPSAAVIVEELCDLGAELFVQVGVCTAIDPTVRAGDLVVVERTFSDDGVGRALGDESGAIDADAELTKLLRAGADAGGRAVHACTPAAIDLFYDPHQVERSAALREQRVTVVCMESSAVFGVARRRSVPVGGLLVVADEIDTDGGRTRLAYDEIAELGLETARIATGAITSLRADS